MSPPDGALIPKTRLTDWTFAHRSTRIYVHVFKYAKFSYINHGFKKKSQVLRNHYLSGKHLIKLKYF